MLMAKYIILMSICDLMRAALAAKQFVSSEIGKGKNLIEPVQKRIFRLGI